jgi:hypothetical protein
MRAAKHRILLYATCACWTLARRDPTRVTIYRVGAHIQYDAYDNPRRANVQHARGAFYQDAMLCGAHGGPYGCPSTVGGVATVADRRLVVSRRWRIDGWWCRDGGGSTVGTGAYHRILGPRCLHIITSWYRDVCISSRSR